MPPQGINPPQYEFTLSASGGVKLYGASVSNKTLVNYLLRAGFELSPFKDARDLLFSFDYRGTLLQVGEEGRLIGNVLSVSVQPRFLLLGNDRGALELRIPLALGLLLQPYAPTTSMLVFNLSLALRDNFLYHVFNWKAASNTFIALGLSVEFSLENSNFSAQSFEVALLQKIENLNLGLAYLFQNQRWDNTHNAIHHLLLRMEYSLRA